MTRLLLILVLLLYPLAVWAHDPVASPPINGAVGFVKAGDQQFYFSDERRGNFTYAAEIRYPPGSGRFHTVYFDNTDAATKSAQATAASGINTVTIDLWRDLLKVAADWSQQSVTTPSSSASPDDDDWTDPMPPKERAKEHYEKGLKNFNEKSYKQAIADFYSATSLDPNNALYEFMLGQAEEARFRTDYAVMAYRRVIALNTDKNLVTKARERLRILGRPE